MACSLGQLCAGFLLQSLGAVRAIVVLGMFEAVVALAASATPSIRNAPQLEELLASA